MRAAGARLLGILAAIVVVALIVAILVGGLFGGAAVTKITAKPRVTIHVYQTENIIQQVALFHERCTGVQEKLAVFKNNYAKLKTDRETARLQTDPLEQRAAVEALSNDSQNVTAALNAAQADAAEYNAAADNPNVAQFRTIFSQHGLPEHIELPAGESAAAEFQLACH